MSFGLHGSSFSSTFLRLALPAVLLVAGCAPRRTYVTAPVPEWDVVATMRLPSPTELPAGARRDLEDAWSALRVSDLATAGEKLEDLGRRYADAPEVATATGFFELRQGNRPAAERLFLSALRAESPFVPAESGLVLAALAAGDEELAYERLLRLAETDPEHVLVDRHALTLRVNVAESRLRQARELDAAGRHAQAAEAYLEALEVAPEAGSLYLEAAEAELAAGMPERAVEHALRASELEPGNPDAFRLLGEASYRSDDLEGALEAYRSASSLRPDDPDLRRRRDELEEEFDREHLPPEYFAIPDAKRLTREQLAALLYVKLRTPLAEAATNQRVIATDILDSWALPYIRGVVGAGVLEVFSNYTFRPDAYVARIELARALDDALELLAPGVRESAIRSSRFAKEFPDLARENIDYEAAAIAASLGLLPAGPDDAFEPQRFVSGAEAAEAVDALAGHMTR